MAQQGIAYLDQGQDYYYRQRVLFRLKKKAAQAAAPDGQAVALVRVRPLRLLRLSKLIPG
jgi:hypothetical protein